MAADYGYTRSQVGDEIVLEVRARRSANQKNLLGFIVVFCPILVGAGWALDAAIADWDRPIVNPTLQTSHHSMLLFAALGGGLVAGCLFLFTLASGTRLRLGPTQLRTQDRSYNKGDILNLGVWSPGSPVVTGRTAFELNMQAARVQALMASEFAVVFDYGVHRMPVVSHLLQPQAHAIAREIDAWLAT